MSLKKNDCISLSEYFSTCFVKMINFIYIQNEIIDKLPQFLLVFP